MNIIWYVVVFRIVVVVIIVGKFYFCCDFVDNLFKNICFFCINFSGRENYLLVIWDEW